MTTQFEQNLQNLVASLDAQKNDYRAKKWEEIKNGELATYRRETESEYTQGVEILRQKRDLAISEREKELRKQLDEEVETKFSEAERYLKETQALFSATAEN